MLHVYRFWRTLLVVLAVVPVPRMAWAEPIRIGSISFDPAGEVKTFSPFAGYLARHLQSQGIESGTVVVAKSISHMANLFRGAKVDLYIGSAFPSLALSHLAGTKLLLRRWKRGIGEYYSVIFVRKDSSVSRLEDLKGRMIAFEEPFSSSGYFVPKTALLQEGLKMVPKADASDSVGPGEVGYVISGHDENTMLWVLRGKVSAGAMDDRIYLKEARDSVRNLKIIYKSFSLPRHIVSYRANLPPKLVARIKDLLTQMDQSEDGRKALQEFEQTTKFDELSDDTKASLSQLEKFIDGELTQQ